MLAATPNHSFHVPLSKLRASNCKKFKILANFSPVNCFPPSKNLHISPIQLSNAAHRTPRTRKNKTRGSGSLCNRVTIGACLAAERDIQSGDAPQQSFAPYSVKIPVGDRHVCVSVLKFITYCLDVCFLEIDW